MPIERPDYPNASHRSFPYFFDGVSGSTGIILGGAEYGGVDFPIKGDLVLVYGNDDDYVSGWCTGWKQDGFSITINTFLNKEDTENLKNGITPGAVTELYSILGIPYYYDTTWTNSNTIDVRPVQFGTSTLHQIRNSMTIFPKDMMIEPMDGDNNLNLIKIEGFISGGKAFGW
jgi:hypothetical protein